MSEPAGGGLAHRELGNGEPLILLNGYAATKDDWDPAFLERLGSHARVICPDNRGVGESPVIDGELTAASMAADTVELVERLGVARASLAGWSMGGFVAQELAAAEPDLFSRVILLSTDQGGPGAVLAEPGVQRALVDRSGTPREQATRLIGLLFPPAVASAIDERFGEVVAAARARLDPATLDAQSRAMEAWHGRSSAVCGEIAQPALVAAGFADRVIPPENAARLVAALDGSWLARFPGGGHAFMAQEPHRLADLIGAFVSG